MLASTFYTECAAASTPIEGGDPAGTYSVHNVQVERRGTRTYAYISWYWDGMVVLDVTDLTDREFLYSIEQADGMGGVVGVGGRWHSAAFTWDGQVVVLGWEPGGGAAGEYEADDADIKTSLFCLRRPHR